MDQKDKKDEFSDLEVVVDNSSTLSSSSSVPPPPRRSYWNEKFLAVPDSPPPPKAKSAKDEEAGLEYPFSADTLTAPPPAYYFVDAKGQKQALYTVPSNGSDAASIASFKGSYNNAQGGWWRSLGEGRRICGLRKNVFLAVMAGGCFLVFGVLTTTLLLTLGRNRPHSNGPSPQFSTLELLSQKDSGPVLAASDLAAMNWTDPSAGTPYAGVVYQSSGDTGAALMMAVKNEATQAWSKMNISAAVPEVADAILPGTPLAAATDGGMWNVYYVDKSLSIAEVYSADPTNSTSWRQGSFSAALARPTIQPGSQLSAMWQQQCASCDNALFVMWQSNQADIVIANMTNGVWGQPAIVASDAAPGSGVAISAFTDSGSEVTTGADPNAIRMYYEQNDGLMEVMNGPSTGGQMKTGNSGDPIKDDLSVRPSPKLASTTFGTDGSGLTNNVVTFIDPFKGALTTAAWKPQGDWVVAGPQLSGGPIDLEEQGFSSVAQTQETKVYLYSPGKSEIHEYAVNSTDVFVWTWTDKVQC
ncbi:hypothetical protein M406DRAFT_69060 [Cryphonectria parasitica EP155]|uniref:Fucose-specific lectin n=1 Tax=Cryphonectria parasitica (strain ATCC 38755 / EP155) TaxID=660469 RepID=A0A9P4Y4P8_CRYP1|nr:uncharacterized protein M406DRAFT_69060 [Cryphonectria parasitica EP155]KAF3766882.1 hypothetical protein M406DRAFT_69060 [Cryphonectria parasitica EP155]